MEPVEMEYILLGQRKCVKSYQNQRYVVYIIGNHFYNRYIYFLRPLSLHYIVLDNSNRENATGHGYVV